MDIFLIYFIVKILMFDWKDQKYSIKETGDDPFKKHFAYVLQNFKFWVKSNISGTKVLQKTIIESQFNRFESDQNRSFFNYSSCSTLTWTEQQDWHDDDHPLGSQSGPGSWSITSSAFILVGPGRWPVRQKFFNHFLFGVTWTSQFRKSKRKISHFHIILKSIRLLLR